MDLLNELRADSHLWFSLIPKDILGIIKPFLYKYEYIHISGLKQNSKKYTYYTRNGKIVLHGIYISYDNYCIFPNTVDLIRYYDHGEKHGIETNYYSDGKTIYRTINWVKGLRCGITCFYYDNGNLRRRALYKDDVCNGMEELFYKNGQVQEQSSWKNDKQDGISTIYKIDGTIVSKLLFKDGMLMGNVAF